MEFRRRLLFFCVVTLAISQCCVSIAPTSAGGNPETGTFPEFSIGDRFVYTVEGSGFGEMLAKIAAGGNYEGYENVVNGDLMIEVTGIESILINGTAYECIKVRQTTTTSVTAIFKEGSKLDGDRANVTYTFLEDTLVINSNSTEVRVEEQSSFIFEWKEEDEPHKLEQIINTITQHYKYFDECYDFPLKKGKAWSNKYNSVVNFTKKLREDGGDWEYEYDNYTEEIFKEYEIENINEVSVTAGSFECFKVKESEVGDVWEEHSFLDVKNGFAVKSLYYSGGILSLTSELKEYRFQNEIKGTDKKTEGDEVGYIPGFEFLGAVLGTLFVAIYVRENKRNR